MITANNPAEGTGVDAAAAAFEQILARESGEPEKREEQAKATSEEEADVVDDEADETADEAQAEDDAAEDDDAAEEDEADESEAEPQTVTLDIEGKAVEVPITELKDGYLRQADYTRKTQQLSEERRSLIQEAAAVREERQQYAATLHALQQQLAQQAQQEPDWDRLWAEDPIEWVRQRELRSEREKKAAAAQFELERVRALQQQEQRQLMSQHVQSQRDELTKRVPEAKDPAKWETTRTKLREYAKSKGYSDEEIAGAYDARAIDIMLDGLRYRDLMSKKPQPAPVRAAPVVPNKSSKPVRRATDVARANMRLAKTGKIEDAADVFLKIPGLI